MTIAAAEDWLIAVCKDTLGDSVAVQGAPYDWDGSYLKEHVTSVPVVLIVWNGGEADNSTSLSLEVEWSLYVVTGWQGKGEEFRRRGDAANMGAYVILAALVNRLHNENMGGPTLRANGSRVQNPDGTDLEPVEGAGQMRVTEVLNEAGAEWDRVGTAIYSITMKQQLPLELPVLDGQLNDWLRTHAEYDIEGGEDVDLASEFDMPQT